MILEPMTKEEIEKIFDSTAMKVLEFYIRRSLFSQPEILPGQEIQPIQIPKEHIEQWLVQAIGGEHVGGGSYPVDVIRERFGADAKMLSCKLTSAGRLADSESGEASIAQKFSDAGNNLDQLFDTKQYGKALSEYIHIFKNKIESVVAERNLDEIYYFFILREGVYLHLCGFKVNIEMIDSISVLRHTDKNIWASNFISEKYGSVRLYKSKKRLELRLRPKALQKDGYFITFDTLYSVTTANLREIVESDKLEKHINELVKKYYS
ncbi:MAG: hypothetical protein ACLSXM_09300 [Turicibacter sanguinis]